MKPSPMQQKPEGFGDPVRLIRGKQAESSLNVAIVGGGKACRNLLKVLDKDRQARLKMKILAVADRNPEAPGLCYARELNLITTTNIRDLSDLNGLNLIIELTGSSKVREEISKVMPPGVSVIDYMGARLLWDLIQIETEKYELGERESGKEGKGKKIFSDHTRFTPLQDYGGQLGYDHRNRQPNFSQ